MVSPRVVRNLKKEFRGSLLAKVGLALVIGIVLVAIFAPFVAPHDPTEQRLDQKQLPPVGFTKTTNETTSKLVDGEIKTVTNVTTIEADPRFPLGTDALGRDMLSRIIYGSRTSLLVGVLGTLLAALVGVPVGLLAGYHGGKVDDGLMRTADVSLAFPSLVLAIALIGLWGRAALPITDPLVDRLGELVVLPVVGVAIPVPAPLVGFGGFAHGFRSTVGLPTGMPEATTLPGTVIIVVALVNWVWFARVARGEALSLRGQEYVKAARALGASDVRIIWRHVLPNAMTPLIVLATVQVAAIILLESALSFLGFSGTTLSWGFDIAQGRSYVSSGQWWISGMPGLAIMLSVIGINLVGDWLRDALDPGIEGEGGGA